MTLDEDIRAVLRDAVQPEGRLVAEADAAPLLLRQGRRLVRRRRVLTGSGAVAVVAAVGIIVGSTGLINQSNSGSRPAPALTQPAPIAPRPTQNSANSCPDATFILPATTDLPRLPMQTNVYDNYSRMPIGASEVVASGPAGQIELLRGVNQNEWAVSVWAHGPVPLQTVTLLGANTTLYPAQDTGLPGPRIPFGAGGDIQTDACSRWELQAKGLTDQQLANYAEQIKPVAPSADSCAAASLKIRLVKQSSRSGFTGLLYVVTNSGNTPCALAGYPQVEVTRQGRGVASAVNGGGYIYLDQGPQSLRVRPGESASFGLTVAGPARLLPCNAADSAVIRMPDGRSTLTAAVPTKGCYTDDIRVTAFVAGSTGPPTH